MRHRLSGRKLGRTSSERKSLMQNLAISLITHKTIKSTLPKVKELRPYVEKLITIAKDNTLANRRLLLSKLGPNKNDVVNELFKLGADYQARPGGYTRIVKGGFRYGDNAPVGIIQLV